MQIGNDVCLSRGKVGVDTMEKRRGDCCWVIGSWMVMPRSTLCDEAEIFVRTNFRLSFANTYN